MICEVCGVFVENQEEFCHVCGHKMQWPDNTQDKQQEG